jgi:hypothetical protein
MIIPTMVDEHHERQIKTFRPRLVPERDYDFYEYMKYQLISKLKRRQDQLEVALVDQMTGPEYIPGMWPRIIRLEGEIERLKGAVAMLRFVMGDLDKLHLDIPGHIHVDVSHDRS